MISHPEYVTSWDQERRHYAQAPTPVDLSGAGEIQFIIHPYKDIHLLRVRFLYTQFSNADAGIELKLGIEADDDAFYVGDSEVSKSQWYSKDDVLGALSWAARKLSAGDTLIFKSAGGKAGGGASEGNILCIIEYVYES
jgi:hypothetical protein